MKRFVYAVAAAGFAALLCAPYIQAALAAQESEELNEFGTEKRSTKDILPGYLHNEVSMIGFYENSLIKYNPDVYEQHSWYNENGTSVIFEAAKQGNNLTLTAAEGKWRFDDGYRPRIVPLLPNGKDGIAMEFNNYFPGDGWRMLIPVGEGPAAETRELYTLIPGHQ